MKKFYSICLFFFIIAPLVGQNTKNQFYPNGQLRIQYSLKNGIYDGEYKSYYESGKLWTTGKYQNGQLFDSSKTYKEDEELASIEFYNNGKLMYKKIYWQALKNGKFLFVSNKGFETVRNGESIILTNSTPDNILEVAVDKNNNVINYIWKGGKREIYVEEKPNGTIEIRYEGDNPGVYEWQEGKLKFKRKLSKEDLAEKEKADKEVNDVLKILNLQEGNQ